MPIPSIILDTSVIVSALRSTVGASYQLIDWIDTGRFISYISNSMIYEYVEVSHRLVGTIRLNLNEIDDILNYVIGSSRRARLYYVWRPVVKDLNDDFVAEAAICSNCEYLVTHNVRDFQGLESYGVKVITPGENSSPPQWS